MKDRPARRRPSSWIVLRALWSLDSRWGERERRAGASLEDVYRECARLSDPPPDLRVVGIHLRTLEGLGLVSSTPGARTPRYRPVKDERTAAREEIEVFLDEVLHDDPVLVEDLLRRVEERREETGGPKCSDEHRLVAEKRSAAKTITGRSLEPRGSVPGPSRDRS